MKKVLLVLLMIFCLTGCSYINSEAEYIDKYKDVNYVTIYSPDGSVFKEGYFVDYMRYSDVNLTVYFKEGTVKTHPMWAYFEHKE